MPGEPRDEREELVGSVVRGLLDGRLGAGLALGRITRSWSDVVGSELAAETAPLQLQEGSLLVAATSSAWAAQVRFLAREIAERASSVGARGKVREVRVIVRNKPQNPR